MSNRDLFGIKIYKNLLDLLKIAKVSCCETIIHGLSITQRCVLEFFSEREPVNLLNCCRMHLNSGLAEKIILRKELVALASVVRHNF